MKKMGTGSVFASLEKESAVAWGCIFFIFPIDSTYSIGNTFGVEQWEKAGKTNSPRDEAIARTRKEECALPLIVHCHHASVSS